MDTLPLTYLRQENTPAIVLLIIAIDRYGVECFEWEPEILRKELEEDFNVQLSDLQSDRLQAAILAVSTDMIEQDWKAFETAFSLLAGQHEDFSTVVAMEAEYLVMGLAEFELLKLGDEDGIQYSDDVAAYAGLVFSEYGLVHAPDVAPWAIMPLNSSELGESQEKREALRELYLARRAYLIDLVEGLKKTLGN